MVSLASLMSSEGDRYFMMRYKVNVKRLSVSGDHVSVGIPSAVHHGNDEQCESRGDKLEADSY